MTIRATDSGRRPGASTRRIGLAMAGSIGVCCGVLAFLQRWSSSEVKLSAPQLASVRQQSSITGARRTDDARNRRAEVSAAPSRTSIRGYVVVLEGTPVENATVCGVARLDSCCSSDQCVNTDSDGHFVFPEQVTAATLVASASGCATKVHAIEAVAEDGARTEEIRLEQDPGGVSLVGAVYDLYGGPIVGAVVSSMSEVEEEPGGVTLSTANGSFALTVRPGAGRLCARAEAYSRVCDEIVAPSDGNTLVLMPESAIVGRVVAGATGEAVSGAMVTATNLNGLRVPPSTVSSHPDGSFAFDGLPPGGYVVAAVSEHGRSAEASVALGVAETSQPVILTTLPAIRLSATVLLGDRPCPQGQLQLSGPIDAFENLRSNGTISIDGLPPGEYRGLAVCRGRPSGTVLDIADRPVRHVWTFEDDREPPESEHLGARGLPAPALIARGGTIKVTVTNPETVEGPIRIFANGRSPVRLRARQSGAEFIFDELANGEYAVHLFDDVEQARSVRIQSPGEIVEVELAAVERGAISGRVLDASGRPVSDTWVSYSRADLPAGEVMVGSPVLTDEDGAEFVNARETAIFRIL